MNTSFFVSLTLVGFALLSSCAQPPAEPGAVPKTSGRRVAAATGGHGNQTAVAASSIAEKITGESSVKLSVFPPDGDPSKPLPGKHRKIAAATGGHGSVVIPSPPAPVETP